MFPFKLKFIIVFLDDNISEVMVFFAKKPRTINSRWQKFYIAC